MQVVNTTFRCDYGFCVNPDNLSPTEDPTVRPVTLANAPSTSPAARELADEEPNATVWNPDIARLLDNVRTVGRVPQWSGSAGQCGPFPPSGTPASSGPRVR